FLWIFGDAVEDRIGHIKYPLLYLGSGLCAAIIQILVDPHSTIPMVGASGAISGILGAYFYMFPKATVETALLMGFFSRIANLPATFFLGFWFLMQLFSGVFSLGGIPDQSGQGIAFWAHASGFVIGIITAKLVGIREDFGSPDPYAG